MNLLPPGWAVTTVGSAVSIKYGKALPQALRDPAGPFPVVGSAGRMSGTERELMCGPCVVIGRKGNLGGVHLERDGCWPIDTTYYLPVPGSFDPAFLFYQLKNLRLERLDSSTATPSLRRQDLEAQKLVVPPLEEQQRIVTILEDNLSRLDAAEAALRTVERRSDVAWRAGLLHATHSLGGQSTRLDEVAEVRLGRQRSPKNHTGDSMRPYLRAANVDWDRLRLEDVKSMNFTDAEAVVFELVNGDVLVVEASGSAGEVGKSAVYRGEVPGACFQNTLLRVRSYGSAIPDFLHYYLLADAASGRLVKDARGVGINHIGRARLAAWPVELPDLDAQRRAVSVCSQLGTSVERLRHAVKAARSRAAALRMAVLAAAFSGRLTETEPLSSEAREMFGV